MAAELDSEERTVSYPLAPPSPATSPHDQANKPTLQVQVIARETDDVTVNEVPTPSSTLKKTKDRAKKGVVTAKWWMVSARKREGR